MSSVSNLTVTSSKYHLLLTEEPLEYLNVMGYLVSDGCGATNVFYGTTRDSFHGRTVTHQEYEAYPAMAMKELEKVANRVLEKYSGVEYVLIWHRTGKVSVGEASLVLGVCAPYRKEVFDATMYGVDELKASVPIFKQEFFLDGESLWKSNCECAHRSKQEHQ